MRHRFSRLTLVPAAWCMVACAGDAGNRADAQAPGESTVASAPNAAGSAPAESATTAQATPDSGGRWTAASAWKVEPLPLVVLGRGESVVDAFKVVQAATVLPDGRILVAHNSPAELSVYDGVDGHFIEHWGTVGQGPAELREIRNIAIREDGRILVNTGQGVVVLDERGAVLGEYLRNHVGDFLLYRGGVLDVGLLADGSIVAAEPPDTPQGIRRYVRLDSTGAVADTIGWFPAFSSPTTHAQNRLEGILQIPRGQVRAVGNRVVVWSERDPHIRILNRSGDTLVTATLPHPVRLFRGSLRAAAVAYRVDAAREIERTILEKRNYSEQEVGARLARWDTRMAEIESGVAYPDTVPYQHFATADDAGNIWSADYALPHEPARNSATVFDAQGRLLGRVAMPDFSSLYHIGRDYVLLGTTDELDVPYVRLHRLIKPF